MKDRIKELRKSLGLTQTQFGKSLGGKSLSAVQKWEMGHTEPDAGTIRLICQQYGVRESWLREGAGPMYAPTGREEEMARLVKRLMADQPDSFQSALVTTLLRFDPNGPEWGILERIYNSIAAEMGGRSKEDE